MNNVFKQVSRIIAMSAIVVSSVFLNSCNKGDEFDIDFILDNLPTEDLVLEECDLPTYISPNLASNDAFVAALKRRFTNVTPTITKDTKVVFIDANDIVSLAIENGDLIDEIYDNNARILMHNTKSSNIFDLDDQLFSEMLGLEDIELEDIDSYVGGSLDEVFVEDPSKEEEWALYGCSKYDDFYQKPFELDENEEVAKDVIANFYITNEDGELEIANECLADSEDPYEMTDFEYGLFADSAISWINDVEESDKEAKALSKSLTSVTKADKDLESLLQYKTITHSISYTTQFCDVKTTGWERFNKLLGKYWLHGHEFTRTIPVEVQIQYAGLHDFDNQCDYYIFKQHLKSCNKSYSCPIKKDSWTSSYKSGLAYRIYTCGPYMKGISVSNKLEAYQFHESGWPTIDTDAKIELLSGKCLPYNENKETPVNQTFNFGLGVSKNGFSFGLGGLKASASLDKGIDMKIGQQYNIDKIKVSKSSNGPRITWNYVGGRICGHTIGTCHDEVPIMQRSDCDMDQAYIYKIENPNNSQIVHSTITTLTSEVLYGDCAPMMYYDHYQEITQAQGPRNFILHRLARYPYTWRRYLDMDQSKIKEFESFISSYFKKYDGATIEAYDIYSKDEMRDPSRWNSSWLGAYFSSFEKELKSSADLFRGAGGPGAGTYKMGFKNTDGDYTCDVIYTITVPAKGDVKVDVEYKGFAWTR